MGLDRGILHLLLFLLLAAVVLFVLVRLIAYRKVRHNSALPRKHSADPYLWIVNEPREHPQSDFLRMLNRRYYYAPSCREEEELFYALLEIYQKWIAPDDFLYEGRSGRSGAFPDASADQLFFEDEHISFPVFLRRFESWQDEDYNGYKLMTFVRYDGWDKKIFELTDSGRYLYHLVLSVCGPQRSQPGLTPLDECLERSFFDVYDRTGMRTAQ